ncbi:phospholipase A2 [Prauserella flava]|nr:phospholipase A2 [Prauserella flava]MCR3735774.1 phospholipase A2 [Prauserella salsuginis]
MAHPTTTDSSDAPASPAPAAPPPRGRRGRRGLGHGLGTTGRVLLLLVVVVGFGFLASRSAPPTEAGQPHGDVAMAQQAAHALLDPRTAGQAHELLPADFNVVTGAAAGEETARDGTVRSVHIDGGCSAPWGDDGTRWSFDTACRAHDLGYDLLRYADTKGHPLDPALRDALDQRLADDMHTTCEDNPRGSERACHTVASLYAAGLDVNSWHQRWGPPTGEPIGPLLAGVAAIGLLLAFRLRTWRRSRRAHPRVVTAPPRPAAPANRWTLLGVVAIGAIVFGESAVALAGWAGADEEWLWPATWLTQFAFVFFFAGGHANLADWLGVRSAGGGYREYLAHRTSWLLRMALVFALVAFAVPTALELMAVPSSTVEVAVRIALHPLWLLGVYVLTAVAAPVMHLLHRRASAVTTVALVAALGGLVLAAERTGTPVLAGLAALVMALIAQQLALVHAAGRLRSLWPAAVTAVLGTGLLAAGAWQGLVPATVLGTSDGPPPLAGPVVPVLLLGLVQLSVLRLARTPFAALARWPRLRLAAGHAARAPMSLYLLYLSGMILLVAAVYLPDLLPSGSLRVSLAVAMLAVPALAVFWWFERHAAHRPPTAPAQLPTARLERLLAHTATAAGVGYATIGVFGFALSSFRAFGDTPLLPELPLDPVQSLVHLLLGMSLLHTVRTGDSHSPRTWLLTALACVPPLLSATAGHGVFTVGVVVYAGTGVLAVAAVVATVWAARRASRPLRSLWRTPAGGPAGR